MKNLFLLLLVLFFSFPVFATHNRAGEITYTYIPDPANPTIPSNTYRVTIVTYTKTSGISLNADRPILDSVHWGDGQKSSFRRDTFVDLPGLDVRFNRYREVHTYPGTGLFRIWFEDPNRNAGVVNMEESVNVPFYVQTYLTINPNFSGGPDNSVVLLQPPIDHGCTGVPFIHNPNAYDPDGDSISYALGSCFAGPGQTAPGYYLPYATDSISINAVTGDFIWDSPDTAGQYNFAIFIYSWRNRHIISTVERDMQVIIETCNNHPPVIQPLNDTCVLAGDTISIAIHATDPDGDLVTLTSTGGPYVIADPAFFTPPPFPEVTVTGHFDWITKCHHIRRQPYHVEFKAQDNNSRVQLSDLKGLNIFVIGPPPKNPAARPSGKTIILTWSPGFCTGVLSYNIYRRNGLYPGTIECPCQTGVPAFTGYTLIDNVSGPNDTTYTDNDQGNGLAIGNQYCYLITAVYADGAESCASVQVCSTLIKDLPVLTNVSVNNTAVNEGVIYVAWSKPSELDTLQFPSPYQYKVYHATGFSGANYLLINTFNDLTDTTTVDTLINTVQSPWSYKVELYYDSSGTSVLKGTSQRASSIFLSCSPSDNKVNLTWQEQVPWTNSSYDIFRLDTSGSGTWDSIATTTVQSYSDSNLVNGYKYCYRIRSVGAYSSPGFVTPIINFSQDSCMVPFDNVPPCSPQVDVIPDCVDEENGLSWNNPNLSCADDVVQYNIYFNSPATNDYVLVATIHDPNITTYVHTNLSSLTGCYKVTAVDSTGNESTDAVEFCVDTCREYVLPSVFTPNGDGLNDFFHPCDQNTDLELQKKNCPPYKNVKDVVMKIFNRWGKLVFETTNKDINWDGKDKYSGNDCTDGVYYYVCRVNFYRLNGTESKELHGFVQLIRAK